MRDDAPAFYATETRDHFDSRQSLNIGQGQIYSGNPVAGFEAKCPVFGGVQTDIAIGLQIADPVGRVCGH